MMIIIISNNDNVRSEGSIYIHIQYLHIYNRNVFQTPSEGTKANMYVFMCRRTIVILTPTIMIIRYTYI